MGIKEDVHSTLNFIEKVVIHTKTFSQRMMKRLMGVVSLDSSTSSS